jgi:hypothetical protein
MVVMMMMNGGEGDDAVITVLYEGGLVWSALVLSGLL